MDSRWAIGASSGLGAASALAVVSFVSAEEGLVVGWLGGISSWVLVQSHDLGPLLVGDELQN